MQYKIAYNVFLDEENDNYEVFSMNTDGTEKINISNHPGVDWVYYAFGDKVYFISDRDTCYRCFFLYETNAKGENIRQVSAVQLNDSWMGSRKNGQEMVVRPSSKLDSAFYIINLKGDILQKIYPGLPYLNDPVFSPDGNQVVFRGAHEKFKKDRKKPDELFLINTDGGGLKQLTHFPESDTTAEWHNYHAGPPQWNENTGFISYMSKQNGKYSIFFIKPEGGTAQRLLPNETMTESYHAWSPGGDWLVIEMKNEEGNYDIYLMDKKGEIKIRLTESERLEQAPVFVKK